MRATLLHRLDAHDRALFVRVVHGAKAPPKRWFWTGLSHLGGARGSMTLCLVPFLLAGVPFMASWRALLALGISHALVQVIKRCAGRTRPALRLSISALIHEPDRFSFPSGHSCAAMAVAASFALVWPVAAAPLFAIAVLVGFSRIVLGVHYPGDVVAGQAIALATTYAVFAWQ